MRWWQAANLSEAGSISMAAGMDQELCNPTDGRGQAFTLVAQAVKDGLMSQAALDRAAVPFHFEIAASFLQNRGKLLNRVDMEMQCSDSLHVCIDVQANVLRAKFAVGLFDDPYPDPKATSIINSPAHKAVAKRVVAEGAVLLQNDQGQKQRGLPFRGLSASSTVAIVGKCRISQALLFLCRNDDLSWTKGSQTTQSSFSQRVRSAGRRRSVSVWWVSVPHKDTH